MKSPRYVNIMAKVSPATAARMDAVVEKLGLRSRYEFMQLAVKLVLSYADPDSEAVTSDMQDQINTLRSLWGDISHLRHEIAYVKPNGGRRVEPSEIITFSGRECLMLRVSDSVGNFSTTTNQRDVLELVMLRTLPPETFALLKTYRRKYNLSTIYASLINMAQHADTSSDVGEEIRQMLNEMSDADPRTVRLGIENKPARAKNKKVE